MQFVFDEPKTAQAAAFLISLRGGRMPYMKLITRLYLADRQSLIESGYPITGDVMYATDHGPVLSRVLDFIHDGTSAIWSQYISGPRAPYEVDLVAEVETDRLSEYDIDVLRRIDARFGDLTQWQLEAYARDSLAEWHDPEGGRLRIDVQDILAAAGKDQDEIEATVEQIEAVWTFKHRYTRG